MKTVEYNIPAGKETLSCSVDYSDSNASPSVIFLHGGGPSSKESTEYLSSVFTSHGKTVIRLDFSGHGKSSGNLKESSLKKRNIEAKTILEYFNINGPITLIGTSMGGYIASTLVRDFQVTNLILFCPAAYSTDAWDVGFSDGFTEIIRAENSFMKTDIPALLHNFQGKSLFFIGNEDDIIPEEVTYLYLTSLKQATFFEQVILDNCPHPIHRWGKKNPEVQEIIKSKIHNMLL